MTIDARNSMDRRAHRVNQVVGCVYSGHDRLERSLVEAITLHNLGVGSDARLQKFRVSGQTTNRPFGLFKTPEKTPSDVA